MGLHLQPEQQLFCSPPAQPSRASTIDRSRVQTPAPFHQHVNPSVDSSVFKYFYYLNIFQGKPYLFPYERHHTNTGEHVLPGQTLTWDTIRKSFSSISPRLTEVTHEERHIGPGNMKKKVEGCNHEYICKMSKSVCWTQV